MIANANSECSHRSRTQCVCFYSRELLLRLCVLLGLLPRHRVLLLPVRTPITPFHRGTEYITKMLHLCSEKPSKRPWKKSPPPSVTGLFWLMKLLSESPSPERPIISNPSTRRLEMQDALLGSVDCRDHVYRVDSCTRNCGENSSAPGFHVYRVRLGKTCVYVYTNNKE